MLQNTHSNCHNGQNSSGRGGRGRGHGRGGRLPTTSNRLVPPTNNRVPPSSLTNNRMPPRMPPFTNNLYKNPEMDPMLPCQFFSPVDETIALEALAMVASRSTPSHLTTTTNDTPTTTDPILDEEKYKLDHPPLDCDSENEDNEDDAFEEDNHD